MAEPSLARLRALFETVADLPRTSAPRSWRRCTPSRP